ncbi:ATP-dependent DNA helicase PIF6-like [Canna indica]|uniref:ATP-dependent DNA helicase PIF6-like n=1 Tax=Canna indica TaxID=4628 RepID=A0AAQ3QAT9_9LILI|nr:ATP-dependent DNA helicase PIF6-like [Canna indica]
MGRRQQEEQREASTAARGRAMRYVERRCTKTSHVAKPGARALSLSPSAKQNYRYMFAERERRERMVRNGVTSISRPRRWRMGSARVAASRSMRQARSAQVGDADSAVPNGETRCARGRVHAEAEARGDEIGEDSNEGESQIEIPNDMLISNSEYVFDELVDFVYPHLLANMIDLDYFKERTILCLALEVVDRVNNILLSRIHADENVYLSSDSVCKEDANNMESELDTFSPKVLNVINCSGLPPHKLVSKVGVPIMLLRNIDQSNGLCNGTRLPIRRLGHHILECVILTGNNEN